MEVDFLREINVKEVENAVRNLSIEANYYIGEDIKEALIEFKKNEPFKIAEEVLYKIILNEPLIENILQSYNLFDCYFMSVLLVCIF